MSLRQHTFPMLERAIASGTKRITLPGSCIPGTRASSIQKAMGILFLFQIEQCPNTIRYYLSESAHYLAACQSEQSMYIGPRHAGKKFIGNDRRGVV
jgi:hypothetical protein